MIFLCKFHSDQFIRPCSRTEMAMENPGKEKEISISVEDTFD